MGVAGRLFNLVFNSSETFPPTTPPAPNEQVVEENRDRIIGNNLRVIKLLGRGATSSVLKAFDLNLDRLVAVKVLLEDATDDGEITNIFLQEGKILAQIDHPNVVRIFASEIDEILKFPVLVMELVDGLDFSSYLEKFRGNFKVLVKCMLGACQGISACHKKEIVHRDLKPENFIITSDGKVKIIDFGIARSRVKNLKSGYSLGTPLYMSPEQFLGKEVSDKSDIYALGIMFWEFLCGKPPFSPSAAAEDSFIDLARQHLHSPPPMDELSKFPHSGPFRSLIGSMLQKDSEKRPEISVFIDILKKEWEPASIKVERPVEIDKSDHREEKLSFIRKSLEEGDPSWLAELEEKLKTESDPVVISALLFALARLGGMSQSARIIPFVKYPDPLVRSNSIEAIAKIGDPETWITIIEALSDPSPRVRIHATKILKEIGLERVREHLQIKILFGQPDVQSQAIHALRFFPGQENLKIVKKLLKSREGNVRKAAEKVMGFFYNHLEKKSEDESEVVDDANSVSDDLKDHVIVCGLDRRAMSLLDDLRDLGRNAVLIEVNSEKPLLENFRKLGFPVLFDSPTDPTVLLAAKICEATHLFAFTENDDTNLEIALKAKMLVSNSASPVVRPPLQCFIHVSQPHRRNLFYRYEGLGSGKHFEPRVFNVCDTSARQVLRMFPPNTGHLKSQLAGKPLHILVLGFGDLGMSVVTHASRIFQGPQDGLLHFSIFDSDVSRKEALFRFNYPKVVDVAKFKFFDGLSPFNSPEFLKSTQKLPVSVVYICFEDAVIAKKISDETRKNFDAHAGGPIIFAFPTIETTSRFDMIAEESQDKMAEALHRFYCENRGNSSIPAAKSSSFMDWEYLRGDLKETNRSQADHVFLKLSMIGARIAEEKEGCEPHIFSQPEIEIISQMEHRRWCVEKILNGWKPGSQYDLLRQTHPALRSWEKLDDAEKEKNRESVRCIPKILRLINCVPDTI